MIEKLGLILDVARVHGKRDGIVFAQGPKALLFEEFTRVYYSCRKPPNNGQYKSEVRYVDFSKDFSKILSVSNDEVVAEPDLGSFDEHGVFPLDVVRVGSELVGYSGGWSRRSSVSIDMSIGQLKSHDDGNTFQREGPGPVLTKSVDEPFLVGDPSVASVDGLLHMFYIRGTQWTAVSNGEPERTYLIAHRVSLDGRSWTRAAGSGPFPIEPKSRWEAQAMPSLVKVSDVWFMFFSFRETFDFRTNKENAYRLGLAYSHDLNSWTRLDDDFESWRQNWDDAMMCYPNAHVRDEKVYVLYNGNEFGRHGFGGVVLNFDYLISKISS